MDNYTADRKRLITSIKKRLAPHLWESGFEGASGKRLKVWFPRDKKGLLVDKKFTLAKAYVCNSFEGFSENAIIVEAFGASGRIEQAFTELPVEDLLKLDHWVAQNLGKPASN